MGILNRQGLSDLKPHLGEAKKEYVQSSSIKK